MPRKKDYSNDPESVNSQVDASKAIAHRGQIVFADELPEGARIVRDKQIDLRSWLGQGVDLWVDAGLTGFRSMLDEGFSTQSVVAYGDGFKLFLEFLVAGRSEPLVTEPSGIRPLHMVQLVGWLEAKSRERKWRERTGHGVFAHIKATLNRLMQMKIILGDAKRFFPPRPFPNAHGTESRHSALSDAELSRLAQAIKSDLVDVHHGRLELRPAEIIAGRFLIVAIRTGGNGTPLIEMSRQAATPGLLPGTQVITVRKHRAKKVIGLVVTGRVKDEAILIPTDAVAILERTLEETEHLVSEAPTHFKDRVWLFRSSGGSTRGEVICLDFATLWYAIKTMVKRRGLLGDDGKPLHVNISRLRKSFSKRAFRLTDGDVVATANLLGNKPKVTESNYLNADNELQAEGANFIASELMVHLRGDGKSERVIPILNTSPDRRPSVKTPVSGCRDTLLGQHAPKDGFNHCDNFVMCLFCSSFAVVGELDELWRLFSFQRFAQSELDKLNATLGRVEHTSPHKELLRKRYRVAIPFIDAITTAHFGAKLVRAAKEKAQSTLHPFWRLQMNLADRAFMSADNPGERLPYE